MLIFTDGSCDNVGSQCGGYAFVVCDGQDTIESYGSLEQTSAFNAEVLAIIRSLIWAKINRPGEEVVLFCDSPVLVNIIHKKLPKWIRTNKFKKCMSPWDIISFKTLYRLLCQMDISIISIKRNSNAFNIRANYLAQLGKNRAKKKERTG